MEKGIEGERIKPSDDKPTLEVEKEGDAEKSEPSKDNLRVGTKRSFDVAFLTGSDTTRDTTRTTPEGNSNSAPEEEEQHKSAFSRYVKRKSSTVRDVPHLVPPSLVPQVDLYSPMGSHLLGSFRKFYDAAKQNVPPPPPPAAPPDGAAASAATASFVSNTCARCGIGFRMTSDLVYHMRTHHMAKRPPAAGGRDGGASDEGSYERKRAQHPLKCHVCGEAFKERHHLTRHMTAHQARQSERVEEEDEVNVGKSPCENESSNRLRPGTSTLLL